MVKQGERNNHPSDKNEMLSQLIISFKVFKSFSLKKPFAVSFDLTNKCNLHCPMCYWQTHKQKKELTDEEMIALAKKVRKRGIFQATWVGGEPLLRTKLLKKLVKIFPINWVVTNGTLSLPKLKNTFYIVSLDGTQKIHDKIRQKNLYKKIKKQISKRNDVITNTTLSSLNKNEPEKLLKEWSKTKIVGMTFNFATPMRGVNEGLYLTEKERSRVINKLLRLKRKYKDFMLVSLTWLESLRLKNVKKWYKECPIKIFSVSFSSEGKKKHPCVLGKNAICSACGCHVPVILNSLKGFDFETIRILYKMISF